MDINYSLSIDKNEYEIQHIDSYNSFIFIPEEINGIPVTTIKSTAFNNNCFIESLSIPNTIKLIEEGAFENTKNLDSIYFRGTFTDINKLEIKRGNCYFHFASKMIALGDYSYLNKILNRSLLNHESILLESEKVFPYQPINYLRTAVGQWLNDNQIDYALFECGNMDYDEETETCLYSLNRTNHQCVILDLIDTSFEILHIQQITNLIEFCSLNNIMVIGLTNHCNKTMKEIKKLFKHKICLNNEKELYETVEMLKNEKHISASTIQIKKSIGFIAASELIQQLVDKNYLTATNTGYIINDRTHKQS